MILDLKSDIQSEIEKCKKQIESYADGGENASTHILLLREKLLELNEVEHCILLKEKAMQSYTMSFKRVLEVDKELSEKLEKLYSKTRTV